MPTNEKRIAGNNALVTRLLTFGDAWEQFAPENKFAGMSLSEFRSAASEYLDLIQHLNLLRLQIREGVGTKANSTAAARLLIRRIVGGVAADAQFGPNSGLYRAMGYVQLSERKRPSNNAAEKEATPVLATAQ